MRTCRTICMLIVVGACLIALIASPAWAQPGGGRRGNGGGFGGGFGGFGFGGGGLADLLRREDVQKELELLDDQIKDLETLAESQRNSFRDMFSSMQDLPREQRMQKLQEGMQKIRDEQQKKIESILLPHQMKRARQLQFQLRLRGGVTRALGSGEVADELGITDAQREKLRQKAQELEEEIRKKLEELRQQAQQELLGILTPAQQAKWKELAGEPFEFQRPQARGGAPRANFGGPRGNAAGQSGPRPGN